MSRPRRRKTRKPPHDSELAERIEAVRAFSRFYTRQIGLLNERLLRTPFSLSEARVVYELARGDQPTASALRQELGIDAGYLSRILRTLEQRGLVRRSPAPGDARRQMISLTESGAEAFAELDTHSRSQVEAMLGELSLPAQRRLVQAMEAIESLLGAPADLRVPYILRPPRTGDLGWVVYRHGVLYSEEYGWDERFEALCARIVADFVQNFDGRRERCWIAEREGENVGSVFLVKHPDRPGVAKLRLLLVEPKARGLGIGKRLVHECTRFARQTGYHTITLWTNDVLRAARSIYEQEGYRLVHEEPHDLFGAALVGQTWELAVRPAQPGSNDDGGAARTWIPGAN